MMAESSVKRVASKYCKNSFFLLLVGILMLSLPGCSGTQKASSWSASKGLSSEQVFNAAVRATADNGFTIVSSDRSAGVISAKKQAYSGDKMTERRLSVQLTKVTDRVVVTTRVLGSDFGVIEGALGGAVNAEITRNFYVYLFRQLSINDPSQRQVNIGDAN